MAIRRARKPEFTDREYLIGVAKCLENAHRYGSMPDEPEGTAWVQFTDTLAQHISRRLREIAERMTE